MTDQEICEWLSELLGTEITDVKIAYKIMFALTRENEAIRAKYNIPPDKSTTDFVLKIKEEKARLEAELQALKEKGRTEPASSRKSEGDKAFSANEE